MDLHSGTYNAVKKTIKANEKNFRNQYKDFDKLFGKLMDLEHKILYPHIIAFVDIYNKSGKIGQVVLNACIKNSYSFYSSWTLLRSGFHGSSRIITRQILEYLIIGKYVSVTKDYKYAAHWLKNGQVDIDRQILRKIKNNCPEIEALWRLLCNYNHATISANQIAIDESYDLKSDIAIVFVLLECNYHLINRHFITPQMRGFHLTYLSDFVDVSRLRKEIKSYFKISHIVLSKTSTQLIREYKATWKFE